MTLKYVAPASAMKKSILHTKGQGSTAQPFDFFTKNMPREVEQAFSSVIMGATDLKDEDWAAAGLPENSHFILEPKDVQKVTMNAIAPWVRYNHPELKGTECTAYICPIISAGKVGHWRGYVVAENEADALTVAEHFAKVSRVGEP